MATHVFGAPCDPPAVERVAAAAGVPLLFDAAHAFGATTDDEPIGRFGAAEVFSMTPTKVLVAGEGGLVSTRDAALARRLRAGRDYGKDENYDAAFVGLNARLSEFHAAMALESMELFDSSLGDRRDHALRYRKGLEGVAGIRCQQVPSTDESTYKDFGVRVDAATFGLGRDLLAEVLLAEGIETRNYFDPPLHTQRAFAGAELAGDLSAVAQLSDSVICLPIYPDLSPAVVDGIVEAVNLAHEYADEIAACRGTGSG
jgi:dTDP-4-amino-4,6-dideoxygalactose transaminase